MTMVAHCGYGTLLLEDLTHRPLVSHSVRFREETESEQEPGLVL